MRHIIPTILTLAAAVAITTPAMADHPAPAPARDELQEALSEARELREMLEHLCSDIDDVEAHGHRNGKGHAAKACWKAEKKAKQVTRAIREAKRARPVYSRGRPAPRGRPAGPYAMSPAAFGSFRQTLAESPFDVTKVAIIEGQARYTWFTAEQVRIVLSDLAFDSHKTQALEAMAPRILDRQNAHVVYRSFHFTSSRRTAQQILARTYG